MILIHQLNRDWGQAMVLSKDIIRQDKGKMKVTWEVNIVSHKNKGILIERVDATSIFRENRDLVVMVKREQLYQEEIIPLETIRIQ